MTDGWTLDELVSRVAEALAADGIRAPNGRVREVPDARALRWYATTGLLDRPAAFRGRTALYGRRHLLQAVAVKRRQAEGMALAQIQAELAGATDGTLHRVARVPAPLLVVGGAAADARPTDARPTDVRPTDARASRAAFWRVAPAGLAESTTPRVGPPETLVHNGHSDAERRHLVRLGPGATLVLSAAPTAADVADLRAAAAPLLRLLADRALLTAEESRDDDH